MEITPTQKLLEAPKQQQVNNSDQHNSVNDFEGEFFSQARPAANSTAEELAEMEQMQQIMQQEQPQPQPQEQGAEAGSTEGADSFAQSIADRYHYTEADKPKFDYSGTDTGTSTGGSNKASVQDKELMDEARMYMEVRSEFQQVIAEMAGSKNSEKYGFSEKQLNLLTKVYMPIYKRYRSKITEGPHALLIVEGAILLPMIWGAFQEWKTSQREKQAVSNPAFAEAAKNAVKTEKERAESWERTRFEIYDNGCYQYGANGYVHKANAKERVDLNNIEHVRKVIERNGFGKLQRAFPDIITQEWCERNGINSEDS